MGTIEKIEYDSEENDEVTSAKSLKGPRCSRILDSDDDSSENISKSAVEDETGDNMSLNEKMEVHDSPSSGDELETNLKKKSLLIKRHISDSESDADVEESGNDKCSESTANVWEINEPIKDNEDHIDESDNTYQKKFLDSDIYDAEGSSDEGRSKISDHEMDENGASKKKKKEKRTKQRGVIYKENLNNQLLRKFEVKLKDWFGNLEFHFLTIVLSREAYQNF